MDQQQANILLEELKSGLRNELRVEKEDFMSFREVLVKREDFKHFRGVALRGGGVIYSFTPEPRS
ncbi:hypothetical protein SAMN05877753_10841 [Bacillus oleivorans]|uniref:Abortive phage infection protein n=1 Tax=Bacillus oleivorans TaxID=1448271 RepID=A0A285D2N7_9BACI|nr:hypothetical protein [Bacillus oleivorans]SNX73925.1 hypothetical protein SAMN05877753_10841 [Bacillus oleivorans]